jgi:bifunctional lysine-specific demethylase and histidyl-hydroxylase NO66
VSTTAAQTVARKVPQTAAPRAPTRTSTTVELTAEHEVGRGGALRRLLGHHADDFAAWGRDAVLVRAADDFEDLFSLTAADDLLSDRGLRTPFIRLAKDGVVLASKSYTRPGGVGATIGDQVDSARVLRLLAGGATVVLQAVHRTWQPLRGFTALLADELRHPVQVNAYITPSRAQGFAAHYDTHDVFVVQVAGTKRWRVHRPVIESPLESQPWTDHRADVAQAATADPVHDVELVPGDVLYLPRGWIHSAEANAETSLHLTFGVHPFTRIDVLRAVLAEAEQDVAFRRSLPLGDPKVFDVDLSSLAAVDTAAVSDRLRQRWLQASRPLPVRPIETESALASIGPGTIVTVRPYLYVRRRGQTIEAADIDVEIPPGLEPVVDRLIDGAPHRLDQSDEAIELIRTLVREGVLTVEHM